ncbi:hypothetical protein PBF_16444 [Cytobacillus firmus DS1]|uniref:SGNH hydrolase-type esterase domain-containing protein n=1 Tax=Cytobacillus firmus DS1 TaxID=1307436 RepID=W7L302_CYTFI|nr:hypothetical protein PBF_16444 [Cytobacillus firmus DS1]
MIKFVTKICLIFALILGLASPASAFWDSNKKVYYIALGDSLAAGQTPFGSIGKGYPDFIAAEFKEAGVLDGFVKSYAKSGYTSKQVLDDIRNNVTIGQNAGIQAELKKATHITLNAGANDLLRQLQIDRTTEAVTFDEAEVQKAMAGVQQNLTDTVLAIKAINPTAEIYIMGYYNPLPHLPAQYQPLLNNSLAVLNTIIEKIAEASGSSYISISQTIAANIGYLPNPQDVHLSEEGYKAVADLFWTFMNPEMPEKPAPEEPKEEDKEIPVVYWEGMVLKKGQIGKLMIDKPINLWTRADGKLKAVRVLNAGETYRVYGYDGNFGGQYSVGGGYYVTKMDGYVNYKTPSKEKLKLVNP